MNENTNIVLKDIFSASFKKAKSHLFDFLVITICFIIISMFDSRTKGSGINVIGSLISFLGSMYLSISLFGAVLKIEDGETVKLKDFFVWPKNGFKMFFADLVSKLAIVPFMVAIVAIVAVTFIASSGVGMSGIVIALLGLLLSIPIAVFISVRLSLSKYFALDTGSGVIDSIKMSYKATKGYFWTIFIFGLLSGLIVFIGFIALVIGLLWAIPTVTIAQVALYRVFNPKKSNLPEIQPVELPASEPVPQVN